MRGMGTIKTEHVLSLATRGYRFNVTTNGSKYGIMEQVRQNLRVQTFSNVDLTKKEVLKSVNFNYINTDYLISQKDFYFLMDFDMVSVENNLYSIFFYNIIKKLVNDRLSEIDNEEVNVRSVGTFSADAISNNIIITDIFLSNGAFITSIEIDFDYVNKYIDLSGLLSLINNRLENKDLVSIEITLTIDGRFDFSNEKYLFDLPMFINCHSMPNDSMYGNEDYLSIVDIFDDIYWNSDFNNFIK
jgi:hypothetical protein